MDGGQTVHDRGHQLYQRTDPGTTTWSHWTGQDFFSSHRQDRLRTSIISVGEIMLLFRRNAAAWEWLSNWLVYRLHDGIVDAAADVDREQIAAGERLGENDNWIAGFARYYREPLISRDAGFDRVEGLRRITY